MAEDLFDGAIGIDLGTTYSYVLSFSALMGSVIHIVAQLCWSMAKRPCRDHRQRPSVHVDCR